MAWRGAAWYGMVWQASEGGSIALIFHDLSHSLLAFRERRAGGRGYEGERERERERERGEASRRTKHKGCPLRLDKK